MDGIYEYGYHVLVWLVDVVVRRYIDILTIIINFPYILHLYQEAPAKKVQDAQPLFCGTPEPTNQLRHEAS